MDFTATGDTTTISLIGAQGWAYIGLDNVSVTALASPVAEPGSLALFGVALMCMSGLSLRRKFWRLLRHEHENGGQCAVVFVWK